MNRITFDLSKSLIGKDEIINMKSLIEDCHRLLHDGRGAGSEYAGWINLPSRCDECELKRIQESAMRIREDSQAFIVIGIGGSYLGARACIDALNHSFYNALSEDRRRGPEIYYAGNNLSTDYLLDLLELLEEKEISINVISKSGSTMETSIAFRIFKKYMERRYGSEEGRKRIYITTDAFKGALRELADREGFTSFAIPDDIGGRYSVLTPVGLLPIAVSGIRIDKLMEGALDGMMEYSGKRVEENISYQYALARNILYNKGKYIELLINYESRLGYFAEWWKQLFGESEGKDNKGIFPASANFTTDLHSLGQIIQDGRRNLFETTINILKPKGEINIEESKDNLDKLNYLSNKSLDLINKKAFEGTVEAHYRGGVPNLIINLPCLNEYFLGKLIYFFKKSCAISAYLLGVNPFNQPGVEEYKRNMFRLLGRNMN